MIFFNFKKFKNFERKKPTFSEFLKINNFDFLKNKIPEKFDIIFLDTLHEAQHVKKIFCYYYKFLKTNGFFFIDDTSWLPYVKNNYRDRFYAEINNQETFKILLEIYFSKLAKFHQYPY